MASDAFSGVCGITKGVAFKSSSVTLIKKVLWQCKYIYHLSNVFSCSWKKKNVFTQANIISFSPTVMTKK